MSHFKFYSANPLPLVLLNKFIQNSDFDYSYEFLLKRQIIYLVYLVNIYSLGKVYSRKILNIYIIGIVYL